MKYPNIGEWVHVAQLGKEITAVAVPTDECKCGIVVCVLNGSTLCAAGGECGGQPTCEENETAFLIYVDRTTYPIARLTR